MEISIIWVILAIIFVIFTICSIAWYYIDQYIKAHIKIATYVDIPLSMKNNTIYINCINVKRYPDLWEAHESDLKIYAMGMVIPSIFFKSSDVPNGYKIAYSSTLSNIEVMSLMAAVKYNKFELSADDGVTKYPINSIDDKAAKKIANKLHALNSNVDQMQKDEILSKIKDSVKYQFIKNEINNDRIISHVDEAKTKSDMLRYQAIIPDEHEVFDKGFAPSATKFYYTYYGKLYEFDVRFVGKVENLYEWELYNLEPGRIYAGFSHSVDGGKTILPSTSLYGITKNENGILPEVSDALLGKPPKDKEPHDIWSLEDGVGYMDVNLFKKTCDILVKKHHEDQFEEDYVSINRVNEFYQSYDWLPNPEDFKINNN